VNGVDRADVQLLTAERIAARRGETVTVPHDLGERLLAQRREWARR